MKGDPAAFHREDPVQHERMEVDVEIEGAAEALNDHHGAAPAVDDALMSGATPQESEHGPQCDAGHGPTQRVIPREEIPQPMWQAQHPLSDGHVREDMINEMRRPLGHASAATPRAEPAAFTRERELIAQTEYPSTALSAVNSVLDRTWFVAPDAPSPERQPPERLVIVIERRPGELPDGSPPRALLPQYADDAQAERYVKR